MPLWRTMQCSREGNWLRRTTLLKSQFIVCVFQNVKGWIDPSKITASNSMPKVATAGITNEIMLFPCLKPFNGFHLCWEPSLWAWFTSVLMLCVCSSLISHHPLSHCRGSLLTVLLVVVFSCWSTFPMLDPWHLFFYAPISSNNSL